MPEFSKSNGVWLNRAFLALSESMRREIIEALIRNPGSTVNDICALFPVSRFVIMRHLNILEEAQLLYREREGNTKQLHIDLVQLSKLNECWLEPMNDIRVSAQRKEVP